jgi:class 3 adenylate cyclase/predicted ATPase
VDFSHVLHAVVGLLVIEGRLSYRRLQAEFGLDDTQLEALRFELTEVKRLAVDQHGEILAWAGNGEAIAERAPRPALATWPADRLARPVRQVGATAVPAPPLLEASVSVASDAERRPLTVLFCDLADSTAFSSKLDPEDLQDVIRAYRESCTGVIRDYEGFVAKYMGDGILVYFGYPKSLERNAERAIRTGLAIVEAMAGLNHTLGRQKGIDIAVRIGIATGLVVVGEIVGEGPAQERTVIGEAPNVAARLQSIAPRNGIVIGALTKEIAGDTFLYEDLGGHELKGISGRVKTFGVVGLRADLAEDEADQTDTESGAAPPALIGRDEEIGLLRRAWQSTKDEGRGKVVLIAGEAGIGKSALVEGLRADVRRKGLPRIAFRCSPYHTNSALYPVIERLKRLLRWQPEDPAETRLKALEAMLAGSSQPLAEEVPLFASLLSLALPEGRYQSFALSPQQQKQQTQDALIAWTLEEAERQPLLHVWEDLHWADPSTLELLGLLIEQAPTVPILIVLTFRPDFVPPWLTRSHMTPITLNRLERQHSEALVARLAGAKPLPAEVVEHIVAKTDGVPLYVEELTKTILASDILRENAGRFELTGPLSSLAIPATLQESLMARLDRLPQVREIAQLGAVLGREFAYEMISGLATVAETTLLEGLGRLVDAELLYQRGRPPRARYIFKHALIQEAAYQSLLKRTRQLYHRRVAELLESKFPEVLQAQPELVARHYTEAGSADKAVTYWQRAGEKALQRSANLEATAHLTNGLEVLRALSEGPERARRELDLLTTMGPALHAIKGTGAPEAEHAYRRALELCQQLGDTPRQFSALHGLWYLHHYRAEHHAARSLAEQLVEVAEGRQDSGLDLAAHRSLGYSLQFLGELETGRARLERAITSYDPAVHGDYALRHGGTDPGVGSLSIGAWGVWALGHPDQALRQNAKGLALARKLEHALSEVWALTSAAAIHQLRGEREATLEQAEAAADLAHEKGLALYVGWTGVLCGWALGGQDTSAAAIVDMRQGLDAARATGAGLFAPYWLALLAGAYGRLGQSEEGLIATAEALTEVARTGERFWEAELYRLKGQLLLERDAANAPEAEACFHRAIEIARSQKARSWELRAATSLARLWRDQGKPEDARALLTPIYDWFTEGFGTADLKDAKALLDQLAPSISQAVG